MRPWNLDLLTSPKVVPSKIKKMSQKKSFKEALQVCPQKKKRSVTQNPSKKSLKCAQKTKVAKENVSKLLSPPLIITDPQFHDFIPTYENSTNNQNQRIKLGWGETRYWTGEDFMNNFIYWVVAIHPSLSSLKQKSESSPTKPSNTKTQTIIQ